MQRGIAENYLRTINPDLALQLFNQSIAALINQEIQNGQTAVSADISDAIRFAWRGLKQKNKKQD